MALARRGCWCRPGVARIAVADGPRIVASELERGEPRRRTDVLRRDLVDRDAVLDVGAGGLAGMDAGQVRGGRAGVIARAIAERHAVPVREAREDRHVLAERAIGFITRDSSKAAPAPFGVQSAIVMPFGT